MSSPADLPAADQTPKDEREPCRPGFGFLSHCNALVIGHVEIAGERRPLCRIHTMELARALLELGFDIELAGGRTAAELVGRLDKRVVEQLERRRVRAAMR